jgi:outer membrane protein OmpA-like peptidoglycan-associated protein
MKRRSRASLLVAIPAGFAMLTAGCANLQQPRQWGRCAAGGAIIGGLAGIGPGYAVGANANGSNPPESRKIAAAVIGSAIGAAIGLVAGHYVCDPIEQPKPLPPPPPPPPPPSPPPPPPPPKKEKLILRGVHFDFNKYNIRRGDAAVLDEAASVLKSNPGVVIRVNGYCDAIGGVAYNLKLSQKRAQAVVDYLSEQGIALARMIPEGFGKTDFVATNDTADGRAQNRRVELVPEQ